MRRGEHFLGDFEPNGDLNESDFRHSLNMVTEPGVLPESQQYDALQALVHWGLEGNRPDLALEAYEDYVVHGWVWQTRTNNAMHAELNQVNDGYFLAREKKEEETGESHDGMSYFSKFDVEHYGAIEGQIGQNEKEGEAFRNNVLPKILSGLLEAGQLQKVHNFLINRREIHHFRGVPRELEPEQCIDVHVWTAKEMLDPASELVFEGNREEAFRDLAAFALDHAQFPQFGGLKIVPRLLPIRNSMIEQGLTDPCEIFVSKLDYAVRQFNEGFGTEFIFNGIRLYMSAAKDGELDDLRTLRDWPDHALKAFDMVEQSPSIPNGLAWLVPLIESGRGRRSASDSMQSSPILGKKLLLAAAKDDEARAQIADQAKPANLLEAGTLTLPDALKLVTKLN